MVRYPLGGNLSWAMQWLSGFKRLGHDVVMAERAGYPRSCFHPLQQVYDDDSDFGCGIVSDLLARIGMEHDWYFEDATGEYHGKSRSAAEAAIRNADVFIDMGALGDWQPERVTSRLKVIIDQEPGYTQMRMDAEPRIAAALEGYDHYFTCGTNLGTPRSTAPTAGRKWTLAFNPVDPTLFSPTPPPAGAPYTTVMNWQSHKPIFYHGRTYGQKDQEFEKFMKLPRCTAAPMEIAVAGLWVPRDRLIDSGWQIRSGMAVTTTMDSYWDYIRGSRGEFAICKNVFIATKSGWFSDRSAAYLASGRPVVLQDTGFSSLLPHGRGLFAVNNIEEAAAAIAEIEGDYVRHAASARELAQDMLSVDVVIPRFLATLGL